MSCVVIWPKQRQHLSYVLMCFKTNTRSSRVCLCADGELFTATKTDFRGIKPQILRYFSKDGRPDVSLETSIRLLEGERTWSSCKSPASPRCVTFCSCSAGLMKHAQTDTQWLKCRSQIKTEERGRKNVTKKQKEQTGLFCFTPEFHCNFRQMKNLKYGNSN